MTEAEREARLEEIRRHHDHGSHCNPATSEDCFLLDELARVEEAKGAYQLGYQRAYEECAKVADEYMCHECHGPENIAAAIRALAKAALEGT